MEILVNVMIWISKDILEENVTANGLQHELYYTSCLTYASYKWSNFSGVSLGKIANSVLLK